MRIKDVDLERGTVTVRKGKGDKDYPRFQRRSAVCMTAPPQSWRRMRRYRARGSGSRCCRRVCGKRWRGKSSARERCGRKIGRRAWPGSIFRERWYGSSGGRRRLLSGFGCLSRYHALCQFDSVHLKALPRCRSPAKQISVDPESGIRRRHHLHGQVYNEAIKRAVWDCGDMSPLSHWPTCRPVEKLRHVGAVR